MPDIKNPEIPVLDSYRGSGNDSFWEKFTKRELPLKAETRVNTTTLKKKILPAKSKMSRTEFNRAKRLLRNLQNGAESSRDHICRQSALKTQLAPALTVDT